MLIPPLFGIPLASKGNVMKKWMREPLVHFILGGALLFFINSQVNDSYDVDNHSIPVDDKALIEYFQYSQKSFDAKKATAMLETMTVEERSALEENYIRDEILYRESLVLGLDANDDVIRARLIQKMDYIILGIEGSEPPASEADLQDYFKQNQEDYRIAPNISFTHVFYKNKNRGQVAATALAAATLKDLRSEQISFQAASKYGERFYFYRNYLERASDFIKSHFGSDMTGKLFDDSVLLDSWQGPFDTEYGAHLVLIRERLPSRLPELAEVAPLVLADYQRFKREQARMQAVEALKRKYRIVR